MKPKCPNCDSTNLMLNGRRKGRQQYQCKECKQYFRGEQSLEYVEQKQHKMNEKTSIHRVHKDDLKKKYDVGRIVDEKLSELKSDGYLMTQSQFIDHCGIVGMKYSDILSDFKYEAYRGKLGGTTYWGHPDDIKDMKLTTPMR
jgi:hypothetical protein